MVVSLKFQSTGQPGARPGRTRPAEHRNLVTGPKGKGESHSQLSRLGEVDIRDPLFLWAQRVKGGAPSPLLPPPKPPPGLKRIGYPFAARWTEKVFQSPDQSSLWSRDLPHQKQAPCMYHNASLRNIMLSYYWLVLVMEPLKDLKIKSNWFYCKLMWFEFKSFWSFITNTSLLDLLYVFEIGWF